MANVNSLEYYTSMLASENIEIKFSPSAKTASFNVESRIITMPMYDFLSDEARQSFISHEVGHALFTKYSVDEFIKLHNKYGVIFNIVEDTYIERMMKQKYPGLNSVFKKGYKNLYDENIFELNAPVDSYSFPDKINLLFKIGFLLPEIHFNDEESKIVAKIYTISNNEDVKSVTKEIYEYVNNNKKNPVIPNKVEDEVDKKESFDNEGSLQDENIPNEPSDDISEESSDTPDENIENTNESSEKEPEIGSTYISVEKNLEELSEEDEKSSVDDLNNIYNCTDCDYNGKYHFGIDTAKCSSTNNHISLITEFANKVNPKRMKPYIEYVKKCASSGNSYFQMLKSARKMKNSTRKQTGSIDSRLLAKYKTTENIFKKRTLSVKETNHGVVILIDYSASIEDYIENVILQTAIMTEFCYKNNIAFEVLLFGAEPIRKNTMAITANYGDNIVIKIADSTHYSIKNILFMLPKFAHSYYGLTNTPLLDALVDSIESIKKMINFGFTKTHIIINTDGFCNSFCGKHNMEFEYFDENKSKNDYVNNYGKGDTKKDKLDFALNYCMAWKYDRITTIINNKSYKIKSGCTVDNPRRIHANYYVEEILPTTLFTYLKNELNTEISINYVIGGGRDYDHLSNDTYTFYGANHKVSINEDEFNILQEKGIVFLKSIIDSPITNVSVLDGTLNVFNDHLTYEQVLKCNNMLKSFIKNLAENIA